MKMWPNPLPDDKILDWPKLKAFAHDYFKVAQIVQFFFDRASGVKFNFFFN